MADDPVKKTKSNLKGAGPGRPAGVPNKATRLLKDAILIAAEQAGKELDKNAEDGLTAYLKNLANTNAGAFAQLMGKVLPLQITGDASNPVGVVFQTVYEQSNKSTDDEK